MLKQTRSVSLSSILLYTILFKKSIGGVKISNLGEIMKYITKSVYIAIHYGYGCTILLLYSLVVSRIT